jgi:LysR family transcriptional regulator, glycine cleavage system transcriptional activator
MDLTRYPLLHDAHNFWPQFLDRAFPQGASAPTKNIRFNQTSLAIDAAIAGQGLALTSLFFVEDDLASGRLIRLFPTELRTGSDFYVVAPRKARHPGSVAAVRTWLARAAGRSAWTVAPTG